VRAAKQHGFDRVVFEFFGPLPNYRVDYLPTPYFEDEGGWHPIKSPAVLLSL
jgi:hypothetical protein